MHLGKLSLLVLQIALFVLLVKQFHIESRAFFHLSLLALGGFIVHALLPFRYRLPFFLLLSLAGIGIVLGPLPGLWLVAIVATLIGLCHLPIPFHGRLAAVLAAALALAAFRLDWLPAPWPRAIWPAQG